jgi:hypothetical protein
MGPILAFGGYFSVNTVRFLSLRNVFAGCVCAAAACLPLVAGAQTVGTFNTSNCYPFSCFAENSGSVYQEGYSSEAFGGSTAIGSVSFFQASAGAMDSATYNISFYLTSAAPAGLSSNLSSNLGTLLANWGTVSVSGQMPSVLTFTGSQFIYDPSLGNLLMQVTVEGATQLADYSSFFEADDTGTSVGRAFVNSYGATGDTTYALVTEFGLGSAIPEPASVAIFVLGLTGVGVARRRRHRMPI